MSAHTHPRWCLVQPSPPRSMPTSNSWRGRDIIEVPKPIGAHTPWRVEWKDTPLPSPPLLSPIRQGPCDRQCQNPGSRIQSVDGALHVRPRGLSSPCAYRGGGASSDNPKTHEVQFSIGTDGSIPLSCQRRSVISCLCSGFRFLSGVRPSLMFLRQCQNPVDPISGWDGRHPAENVITASLLSRRRRPSQGSHRQCQNP